MKTIQKDIIFPVPELENNTISTASKTSSVSVTNTASSTSTTTMPYYQ